ncbi:MAG: glutathione S-transferase N-terminal domain-containing protein [Alphaproteobacteria bacterium]|nr:glutathione S-transferase N-terminal domain-containing protein [Alphaproteobacteria bacterium]
MITLYTWGTHNGHKPLILLEELGLPYTLVKVDLGRGHQRQPDYLAINPNGRIPALVDGDSVVFESGAILLHLADREGRFVPPQGPDRAQTLSWLFFQMASVGPMLGQRHHFTSHVDDGPYALQRYDAETHRVLGVLDRRLAQVPWLDGAAYSIADIATFPWVHDPARFGVDPGDVPHLVAWAARIADRPAVQRALAVPFP